MARALHSSNDEVAEEAVATVSCIGGKAFEDDFRALANDNVKSADLRVAALMVLALHGQSLDDWAFQMLAERVQAGETPPLERLAAARALGAANLTPQQQVAITDLISRAGPLELPALVGALEKTTDSKTGRKLLDALNKSPGCAGLSAAQLEETLAKYPNDVRLAAQPLLAKLRPRRDEQLAHLAEVEHQIGGGDPKIGREVFFGRQAGCSACHTVRGEGGHVGPDLSTIGQSRSPRDLLEAVLYPSASIARGYETYVFITKDGQVITGIVTRQTADTLYVHTSQQIEVRVPRRDTEIQPSLVSVMPAGLENTMSPEQLRHLLAFLQSLKTAGG